MADYYRITWVFYLWMAIFLSRVDGESQQMVSNVRPVIRVKRLEHTQSAQTQQHAGTKPAQQQNPKQHPHTNDLDETEKVLQFILEHIDKSVTGQNGPISARPTPAPLDTGQGRTTPVPLDTKPDTGNSSGNGVSIQNANTVVNRDGVHLGKVEIAESQFQDEKFKNTGERLLHFDKSGEEGVSAHHRQREDNADAHLKYEKKTIQTEDNYQKASGGHATKGFLEGSAEHSQKELVEKPSSHVNHTAAADHQKLQLVPFADFVRNVAHKKHIMDNKDHPPALHHSLAIANKDGEATKRRHHSLVLLQNVTEEAEKLKNRLKSHKLKLKSYVDELKNISLNEQEEDRKMTSRKSYADSIRKKVDEIINPQKHGHDKMDNNREDRVDAQHHHQPGKVHLFTKDVPETLRARVDFQGLKKSANFWEKKGVDIPDEHLQDSDLTKEPLVEDGTKIRQEDQLDLEKISTDYNDESRSFEQSQEFNLDNEQIADLELITKVEDDDQNAADHIIDYHKAKLGDINSTRTSLRGMTQHELFLMSQIVSGRIHGNILAPPPERCSVSANMKRYRPPEETMNEDDSLLYRVNLKPEMEAALEGGPMNYLPDYKNPCWLSKITNDKGSLWYDFTETGLTYKRMSYLYEMRLSKGNNWRMRCLPYLYLIGVTKSGTTDLYTRILGHPEIMRPGHKEPMWWNRLTLGMAESLRKPFRYYVDFFDEAAELIRRKVILKDDKIYHPAITLDATPANLWDYDCWTDIPGNRGLAEPKYTLAHSIKKLVPDARILMILREPTSRLYSQYRMKSHMEPSATFHKLVLEAVANFNKCLQTRTLRSCAYDHEISKHEFQSPGGVFLRASLYYVFVKDWLSVFPREQVLVLRTEDYHNDTARTLERVFQFLGVSPLSPDRLQAISRQHRVNSRTDYRDRSQEPMLPATQRILDDFFSPYNKMLAKLLHDKRFKWNDVRESR